MRFNMKITLVIILFSIVGTLWGEPTADLFKAVRSSNIDKVKRALAKGAKVNFVKDGHSPLLDAIILHDANIVALLIRKGANVNLKIKGKKTLLELAIFYPLKHFKYDKQYHEIASFLINNGATYRVNKRRKNGLTFLMQVSKLGWTDIAKVLLENGANVNAQYKKSTGHKASFTDGTALSFACKGKHLETIKLLIANGANVNVQLAHGWTSLMYASWRGNVEIVKILVFSKVNVKQKQRKTGDTALTKAKKELQRYEKMMREGEKIPYYVSLKNYREIILILESPQKFMDRANVGKMEASITHSTPAMALIIAAENADINAVKKAISMGADINSTYRGRNALHAAIRYYGIKTNRDKLFYVIKFLCQQGIDLNALDKHNHTILYYAKKRRYLDLIKYLKTQGAKE